MKQKWYSKNFVWGGVSGIITFLLVFVIFATGIAYMYATVINQTLNIPTYNIYNPGDEGYPGNATTVTDTQYFKSDFGAFTKENQTKLIEASFEQAINEMKEGAALLYNNNNALPLDKSEEQINFFGRSTVAPLAAHMGAGPRPQDGYFATIDIAMRDEGFTINEELLNILKTSPNAYRNPGAGFAAGCITTATADLEDPISVYTEAAKESWAKYDKGVAVYTVSRSGAEGTDMKMYDDKNNGKSSLALHDKEKAILEMLKAEKQAGRIKKIIVLLNTGNVLEVNWLKDYDVDACLHIGSIGSQGARGVASILSGGTNPSGHLVDTYAVNSLSAPAVVNAGDNTSKFTNSAELIAELDADRPDGAKYGDAHNGQWVSFQAEGIYIGYKYYETRYEDYVLNRYNAKSGKGASNGASEWKYENEVSYPFGHGLSYTDFDQKLDSVKYNKGTDIYEVKVTVKNTGSVAGKSVVQVYAQTPYEEYEKTNKIEKAAVNLVDFGKTKILDSGESETLTINVDRYLLASYDHVSAKGYYLSAGDYYFGIGENAHDALNNIIKAKKPSVTGLVNYDGTSAVGDASKAYRFELGYDADSYKYSSEGVLVTNRFDDADINYWVKNSGTYLSRSDWDSTYPVAKTTIAAPKDMFYWIKGDYYKKADDAPTAQQAINTLGKDAGIKFVSMKDVAWEDDSTWMTFLKQMSFDELLSLIQDSAGRAGIKSIGLPDMPVADGVDGMMKGRPNIPNLFPFDYEDTSGKYGTGLVTKENLKTTRFPSKFILTGTFNKELYANRGRIMGEEGLWSNNTRGLVESWNIGGDLHRTPFGGRSNEYCSEDANMTYLATIGEVKAMQEKGVISCPKHLAGNDQEFERHGVCTFFNEQAWREGSLRGFEGAIRVGKARGYMQSFSRLGAIWASSSHALNYGVVFGEWGFRGHSITDGTDGSPQSGYYGYMGHYATSLVNGSDMYCLDSVAATALKDYIIKTDDGDLIDYLLVAAKHNLYAMSRSNAINGLSSDTIFVPVTPWWKTTLIVVICALSVLEAAAIVMLVISKLKDKKSKETI